MADELFLKIIQREIPADILFEDERVIAFKDIAPQAPVHFLVVPKKRIETINVLEPDDASLVGHMVLTAREIANAQGIAESGYRLVFNCNPDGGQTVYHIHLHVLGGRGMRWPPG